MTSAVADPTAQVPPPGGERLDEPCEVPRNGAAFPAGDAAAHPECYVVVHNVAKRHNLGTLARSCTAFGVRQLALIGRRDFNAFGSHGAADHVSFQHYHSLADMRARLKERGCDICGVEIVAGALPVHSHPFRRSTAFVLGNEGSGLSAKEKDVCDFFVYIPQHGAGTASLNVTVAASIVLHHFAVWAQYPERGRDGEKFVVGERPLRRMPRNMAPGEEGPAAASDRRRQRAEQAAAPDWLDEEGGGALCDAESLAGSEEEEVAPP